MSNDENDKGNGREDDAEGDVYYVGDTECEDVREGRDIVESVGTLKRRSGQSKRLRDGRDNEDGRDDGYGRDNGGGWETVDAMG